MFFFFPFIRYIMTTFDMASLNVLNRAYIKKMHANIQCSEWCCWSLAKIGSKEIQFKVAPFKNDVCSICITKFFSPKKEKKSP